MCIDGSRLRGVWVVGVCVSVAESCLYEWLGCVYWVAGGCFCAYVLSVARVNTVY